MTAQMTEPATVEPVLDRIQTTRTSFDTAVARLTDEQFTAAGAEGQWSVKDLVAHVATWEQGIAALLQHEPRFAAMGVADYSPSMDIDTVNDRLYELHQDRPSGEVLAMAREAHERAVAVIASLCDDDLQRPYRDYAGEDRPDADEPIINWIAGDTYEHYAEHLPVIRAQASQE